MSELTEGSYQSLLNRLGQEDPAVHQAAMNELIEKAYARLQRLVAKIMNESFRNVNHDVDSVVNTLYMRLLQAFKSDNVRPANPAEFFKLAAFKVRQTLLDYVAADKRKHKVGQFPEGGDSSHGGFDPGESTLDPTKIEIWRELHEQIQLLPEELKTVFSLRFYLDLSNKEIAESLQMHPKQVSRQWLDATERLAKYLPS